MNVVEIFGPTLQGEGPLAGTRCAFVRLGGCNLSCPWCDTAYAQSAHGSAQMDAGDVLDSVVRLSREADPLNRIRHLVVTGGEPMIASDEVGALARIANLERMIVHLETNGSIAPTECDSIFRFGTIAVSPKLHALNDAYLESLEVWARLTAATGAPFWKFVIGDEQDAHEADDLIAGLRLDKSDVYLMPRGATRAEQIEALPRVAQMAVDRGYNFTPRLHVLAWDTERGV